MGNDLDISFIVYVLESVALVLETLSKASGSILWRSALNQVLLVADDLALADPLHLLHVSDEVVEDLVPSLVAKVVLVLAQLD